MSNQNLNVLMVSDNGYANILTCALASLFEHNRDFQKIIVYLVNDGISKEKVVELLSIARYFQREIIFLEKPNISINLKVKGAWHISTFYRLYVATLLPKTVNKVLYLDCDVLIVDSLCDLWETNFEAEQVVAGVLDTTGPYARKHIGLKQDDIYINAGVLLINLHVWRKQLCENMCFAYLDERDWDVEFNDQGVINAVCRNKIKLISPRYNYMPTYQRYSRKNLFRLTKAHALYSQEELTFAKEKPAIIHFAGYAFVRPWYKNAYGRFKKEFLCFWNEYCTNEHLKQQPKNFKYFFRKLIYILPDRLSVIMSNFMDTLYCIRSEKKKK